jgi:plasmid stability protein
MVTENEETGATLALESRYSASMATIQIRDLPDDVAATFRRRAAAAGRSLQSYMREQLIDLARRRDKAEAMAIMRQALANDPGPGASVETIDAALRELRGE